MERDAAIVEVGLNEAATRAQNPYVPYAPEECAEDARRCAEAGAAVVHWHARDPITGAQRLDDAALYGAALDRMRPSGVLAYPSYPPWPVSATDRLEHVWALRERHGLEPLLEEIVHELLDAIAREPRADLVSEFTERYPVQVSAHLLGIPRADHPRYRRWAMELMGFTRDFARAEVASAEIRSYLLPILAARRTAPRDDIVTRLVQGTVDGERLSDEDVVSFLRLLIPAGAETTFRLIGNMLVALLTERDRLERVRADRSLVSWAIEETLR